MKKDITVSFVKDYELKCTFKGGSPEPVVQVEDDPGKFSKLLTRSYKNIHKYKLIERNYALLPASVVTEIGLPSNRLELSTAEIFVSVDSSGKVEFRKM